MYYKLFTKNKFKLIHNKHKYYVTNIVNF